MQPKDREVVFLFTRTTTRPGYVATTQNLQIVLNEGNNLELKFANSLMFHKENTKEINI